ncbi:FxSxx-COOH system tetratricopeptide repeat protein [Streptomyces sp. NPDC047081]|uniref:FxSxx-COOH system tetratricopeptide repeat protein n=1 Tax=Streptomyces sp. NPDC047081 TaxID=3154706 RepID=UPI0033C54CDE
MTHEAVEPGTGRPAKVTVTPAVWGSVPPRNPDFTGREDLLEELHRRLLRDRGAAVVPQSLYGLGGVGKTSLAVQYLYRWMTEYDVVWWISAEQTAQISASLAELAPHLGVPAGPDVASTVGSTLEALRFGRPYSNWLLVLDNAESPEEIRPFLPTGGPGTVLITSRNPHWTGIARPLEVDVFTRAESKSLLRGRSSGVGDADADRLAEALGDLPLAIEQAAAWHAETGMPVDEYLGLLAEKRVHLLRETALAPGRQPVTAAWNISLDRLESEHPAAYRLLQICSLYAPGPIPRALFKSPPGTALAPELDPVLGDPIRLGQVIREIGRFSLARVDPHGSSLQMHRLVQAVVSSRMSEQERAVMLRAGHLLLAANDPNDPDNLEHWGLYGSLHPHVLVSDAVASDEHRVRNLVVNEVVYLLRWGDYASCLELARAAHQAWSRTLGEDHPQALQVARWLGFLHFNMGRYQEAAQLNAAVLETYRRALGPEAQDTIDALGNVAIDHRARGDFNEALSLSESVHQQYLRLLGPEDPETLRAAHNLGVSLRLVGDFTRARGLDRETWQGFTTIYGQDHVSSLRTWIGYVVDVRELGQYSAALTYHREATERIRTALGRNNPMCLAGLRLLATTLRKAGESGEALAVAEQARADLIARYGDLHPESLAAALELSVQLRCAGRLQPALTLGMETWHLYEQTYGRSHPHTLSSAVSLAVALRSMGNPAAARRVDTLALRGFVTALGETHPSTLACRTNLAGDHYTLGDTATALDLDTETLRRSREVLDDDHPSTLACAANLAMDLRALGRTEEADILRTDTKERLGRKLGRSHPAFVQAADQEHRADQDIDPMPL